MGGNFAHLGFCLSNLARVSTTGFFYSGLAAAGTAAAAFAGARPLFLVFLVAFYTPVSGLVLAIFLGSALANLRLSVFVLALAFLVALSFDFLASLVVVVSSALA